MKTTFFFVAALFALFPPALFAVDNPRQTARFTHIEKKAHDRVMYNIGNTPIIQQDPYYAMTLESAQGTYQLEYETRTDDEELPATFVEGAEVEVRIAGRHLFIKRPGGGELNALIVKRNAAKASRQ